MSGAQTVTTRRVSFLENMMFTPWVVVPHTLQKTVPYYTVNGVYLPLLSLSYTT